MASSNSNQVNEKATMPSNQDWTEILKTPLTADFSHNFMDASVHFPEADMDSPPTKTVNPACRQENRVGHGNTMQSVENNVHEASMEDDDLDKPSGRPVQQFAMVRRSEEDPNGILSPSTLTPGFARKLDEMCPRSDSEDTPYALQQQHYYSSQTYGASNPAFHLSDTRRGPHRSHSAIQVSRDLYSISQHAHPSRQPQAPYFQYNGAERNSVTPQPDASRKSTTAAGLARQFRPAAAAAPTRALSQPIINARNQQSIEAVHEHQQSLAYRGPPPQVTAAQPEADTPKLLTFQSLGDAVASQTPRQNFNFNNDPTYPHDQQAVQKYVLQLYCAMYDMKEATDSIKIMESWQKALNKESKAVEVTCWILLDTTMRAHRQKEPLVPLMSKGSKGQQKFETFGDHVDALCSGMRRHKTICHHLMAPSYNWGYIDNPSGGTVRVGNNRKVNLKKKQTIDLGRQVAQNMRAVSGQGQSIEPHSQKLYPQLLPSTEQEESDTGAELPLIKRELSSDGAPKAAKGKKRKASEPSTNTKSKKSKNARSTNFPIQTGPDGKHYVVDPSSHQYHAQLPNNQSIRAQPIDQGSIDPSLTARVPSQEQTYHNRSHHIPQAYAAQDYGRAPAPAGQLYPHAHPGTTYDGAGYDEPNYEALAVFNASSYGGSSLPAILTTGYGSIDAPLTSPYHDLSEGGHPGLPMDDLGNQFLAVTTEQFCLPSEIEGSHFNNNPKFATYDEDAEGESIPDESSLFEDEGDSEDDE